VSLSGSQDEIGAVGRSSLEPGDGVTHRLGVSLRRGMTSMRCVPRHLAEVRQRDLIGARPETCPD
jgi:hypothetical protein